MLRKGINSIGDYQQLQQEFESKKQLAQGSGDDPAAIKEWQAYSMMSPADQARYLTMKRSSQIMNLGGTQQVYDPLTGGTSSTFQVTPKPEDMPAFKAAQEDATQKVKTAYEPLRAEDTARRKANVDLVMNPKIERATTRAGEVGKGEGEAAAKLQAMAAQYPRLVQVANELSTLGKKATYTIAGQAVNAGMRQAGLPVGEGAVARKEYMAKVDNEILPLLRQTFGAQFTVKEGESLRATLGDVNASPEEKDAVLNAFIAQKAAEIESLKRQTGQPANISAQPSPDLQSLLDKYK